MLLRMSIQSIMCKDSFSYFKFFFADGTDNSSTHLDQLHMSFEYNKQTSQSRKITIQIKGSYNYCTPFIPYCQFASHPGLEPGFMASKAIVLPLDEWEMSIPNGIRTRVATVKGWSPRPLDHGDLERVTRIELAQPTWKDGALPLCNTRLCIQYNRVTSLCQCAFYILDI